MNVRLVMIVLSAEIIMKISISQIVLKFLDAAHSFLSSNSFIFVSKYYACRSTGYHISDTEFVKSADKDTMQIRFGHTGKSR